MMVAPRTSETSVDNYFTQQYIPEDKSELYGFLDLPYRFSE
jgi:Holliday junction resolvasome RuvABC DNA-binding subunit